MVEIMKEVTFTVMMGSLIVLLTTIVIVVVKLLIDFLRNK